MEVVYIIYRYTGHQVTDLSVELDTHKMYHFTGVRFNMYFLGYKNV